MPGTYNVDGKITVKVIAEANNEFAFSLYKKLGEEFTNIVFSPYSLSSALAVTYAGARGTTALEMSEVLWFPKEQDTFHPVFKAFTDSLLLSGKDTGAEISIANALWIQDNYPLIQDFLDLAADYYKANAENVSFKTTEDREKSRQKINQWVENKTNDKIKELIPQGILSELTRMVITNAIWFNGNWLNPFDKSQTSPSVFHITPQKTVSTDFMHQQKEAGYYEDDEVQAIELPYKNQKLSMLVILPREIEGWKLIGRIMTGERLEIIKKGIHFQTVKISLPKFSYESEFQLKQILYNMGMEQAFTNDADFSGMTEENELRIDDVIHKAFIEVSETGTEAAAATAVTMALKTALEEENITQFVADHPFLYFIMDKSTGGIIFMGRVINPE
ncbi:MAG: hypothetical protein AMS27_10530 [Bacteroides sp. SM23_62_1]|nr:MAG: hypothetical protein AMS27_10530 [Bacteroides sp. SM23_62_1]